MSMGDGPRTARPSEDAIRRRLIERRIAHERERAETGWTRRLTGRRNAGEPSRLRGAIHARPSLVGRLRRRPVSAFFVATAGGIAIVAAVLLATGIDVLRPAASNGSGAMPQLVAGLDASAKGPVDDRATAVPPAGTTPTAAASVKAVAAESTAIAPRDPRLRDTVGALPPTVPGPALGAPSISTQAVAAALALRLPQNDEETPVAAATEPDRLTTTGSITTAAPAALPASEIAGSLEEQAETLAPKADAPALAGPGPSSPAAPPGASVPSASESDRPGTAPTTTGTAGAEARIEAKVTASVNMRQKPDNDATIVAVLARGQSVGVLRCEQWCEVTAGGKIGYVFKSFIDGAG